MLVVSIFALICYSVATALLLWRCLRRVAGLRWAVFGVGLGAICLHAVLLHAVIDSSSGQNLSLLNVFSLVMWCVAILELVAMLFRQVDALGLVVFPMAMLAILLSLVFPHQRIIDAAAHPDTLFHILLALLTFCVLLFAGILAGFLAIQEWLLRSKRTWYFLQSLPALQTMESLLFQVITLGFVLLSAVVVTSLYFYFDVIWHHVAMRHKAVFVIAAWLLFAVLLLGRQLWGWRGRRAINYTLVGVVLLLFSYFGSQFFTGW